MMNDIPASAIEYENKLRKLLVEGRLPVEKAIELSEKLWDGMFFVTGIQISDPRQEWQHRIQHKQTMQSINEAVKWFLYRLNKQNHRDILVEIPPAMPHGGYSATLLMGFLHLMGQHLKVLRGARIEYSSSSSDAVRSIMNKMRWVGPDDEIAANILHNIKQVATTLDNMKNEVLPGPLDSKEHEQPHKAFASLCTLLAVAYHSDDEQARSISEKLIKQVSDITERNVYRVFETTLENILEIAKQICQTPANEDIEHLKLVITTCSNAYLPIKVTLPLPTTENCNSLAPREAYIYPTALLFGSLLAQKSSVSSLSSLIETQHQVVDSGDIVRKALEAAGNTGHVTEELFNNAKRIIAERLLSHLGLLEHIDFRDLISNRCALIIGSLAQQQWGLDRERNLKQEMGLDRHSYLVLVFKGPDVSEYLHRIDVLSRYATRLYKAEHFKDLGLRDEVSALARDIAYLSNITLATVYAHAHGRITQEDANESLNKVQQMAQELSNILKSIESKKKGVDKDEQFEFLLKLMSNKDGDASFTSSYEANLYYANTKYNRAVLITDDSIRAVLMYALASYVSPPDSLNAEQSIGLEELWRASVQSIEAKIPGDEETELHKQITKLLADSVFCSIYLYNNVALPMYVELLSRISQAVKLVKEQHSLDRAMSSGARLVAGAQTDTGKRKPSEGDIRISRKTVAGGSSGKGAGKTLSSEEPIEEPITINSVTRATRKVATTHVAEDVAEQATVRQTVRANRAKQSMADDDSDFANDSVDGGTLKRRKVSKRTMGSK